jgi:Na+/phosphate symporter
MALAWIALVVCIVGALVYALASNAKAAELGRIAYFVGLFVTIWHLGTALVRIG